MALSSFLITRHDVRYAIEGLTKRKLILLAATAVLVVALHVMFGFDVAYLLSGVAIMTLLNLPHRLPFYVAIFGLVLLMLMTPLVDEANQWERWSDRIAVQVFFMMIFGVYRMILDEVLDSAARRSDQKLEGRYTTNIRRQSEDSPSMPLTSPTPNQGAQQRTSRRPRRPANQITDLRGAQPTKRRRL